MPIVQFKHFTHLRPEYLIRFFSEVCEALDLFARALVTDTKCRRHQRIHGPRPHVCETCQKRFSYPKDLRRHQAAQHLNSLPKFHCPHEDCKHRLQGFSREDNFRRHLRTKHERVESRSGEETSPAVPPNSQPILKQSGLQKEGLTTSR